MRIGEHMEYQNFDEIVKKAQNAALRRGIVAGAEDEHVLAAVFEAKARGIAFPVLADDKDAVSSMVRSLGFDLNDCTIVEVPGGENPAQRAVDIIASGGADFLIKGKLDTKDLLKPVVDRKNGLHLNRGNVEGLMSHLAFFQIPGERKLISVTDGGMVVSPNLETKKGIIVNAVEAFGKMGYENPKVAVLCAVEKFNEKMQETVDARDLTEANKRGEISGCLVEGPISYDVAMRADIAELKGYDSPNCGNFDILVVPDITAGNLLGKALIVNAGAKMAGIIVGAKIPVVVTSRGASAEEKFNSIALCAVAS